MKHPKFDPLAMNRTIAGLERALSERGVIVKFGVDFELLEFLVSGTEKGALSEHFQTALNTYTPANAFWIGGFSEEGQLVALCAVRLDDLADGNLCDFAKRYWRRCYPDATGGEVKLAESQPRFLNKINGRVAYYGDFFFQRVGFQGRQLPRLFAPLVMLMGVQAWQPDWHYCWIRPKDWAKRYPLAYGFVSVYPSGLLWERPPATIDSDLVIASNSANDALDWFDHLKSEYALESNNR